jgi:anti-sigma factor RsiW
MVRFLLYIVDQPRSWKMNCRATIRLICDYLEGRLSSNVAREVSQHLSRCQQCHSILTAAEETLETDFGADPRSLPHPTHA